MQNFDQVWRDIRAQARAPRQQIEMLLHDYFAVQVDQFGFLQLTANFLGPSAMLSPADPFFRQFREQVRQAFPTADGLRTDELGHEVHLFRSYLDLFYLNYLRHYRGRTDFERLQNFARDHQMAVDYTTNARYHNRTHRDFRYPQQMKVQLIRNSYRRHANPARMIELIVNLDSEQFVSEWSQYQWTRDGRVVSDPRRYRGDELAAIDNTESFNYGIPHGQYWLWPCDRHSHQWLDVQQPADNQVRRRAKRYWRSPPVAQYCDLVRDGTADVRCWQGVPRSVRRILYQDFLDHQRHAGGSNWGINYYCRSTFRYQHFAITKASPC